MFQPSTTRSVSQRAARPSGPSHTALVASMVFVIALGLGACSSGKTASVQSSSGSLSATDQLLQEGLNAQGQGQLDVARQKYLEVIRQDPTHKIAHYDLGVIYQQLNDIANARDSYQKAITIDSKYQPALFNLAVLETPINPTRAEELYRQLLQINPQDANVHFNLGLLLKQVGRTEEGDREVATAVQINPEFESRIPPETESTSSSSAN